MHAHITNLVLRKACLRDEKLHGITGKQDYSADRI